MSLVAILLAWFAAGRVLRPLRTITSAAHDMSVSNLHERLAMDGPDDELKELGDTFDQLLERLEQGFESQKQFVANASHELRTPLATMRALVDVALAKPGPVPEQLTLLGNRLHDELDHVDQLLDGFLVLARAQRGPVIDDTQLSLDMMVESSLRDHVTAIAALGLTVGESDCPEALVGGNETLLTRMVGNLIDNAVLHNQAGGWIRVTTEADGETAWLVVENGGPLLVADDVASLVEPFRRLGVERTGSDSGIGLGLSIVAAVAASHGGSLVLHAGADGGIRAVVELPLAVPALVGASV